MIYVFRKDWGLHVHLEFPCQITMFIDVQFNVNKHTCFRQVCDWRGVAGDHDGVFVETGSEVRPARRGGRRQIVWHVVRLSLLHIILRALLISRKLPFNRCIFACFLITCTCMFFNIFACPPSRDVISDHQPVRGGHHGQLRLLDA